MEKKYPICHISRLRMASDGEGIRSLVLVSGCPLRCRYCINPYTWDGSKGSKMLSASDVYSKIKIDRPYIIATNGGITVGGGEPLLYPQLVNEIRNLCELEMTIYVETSLHVDWNNVELTTRAVDRYYVDIKALDRSLYKNYTGAEIDMTITNLKRLVERSPEYVVVRIPEIPGFKDKTEQIKEKRILKQMGVKMINMFKYRTADSLL